MLSKLLRTCRSSIQFKLFLSLTAIVALALAAILASQVYLIQDFFNRQAEANLRNSNYLLSRFLADPLFEHDASMLQSRLQDVQAKLPLCNFQLKDNIGTVVYKVGEVHSRVDTEFDPSSRDGCYNTVVPVLRGNQLLGTVRLGVRTDDLAKARQSLIRESVAVALFWFTIFMLPFIAQIRRMVQPLGNLAKSARQFARDNLSYPAPDMAHGEDEIAQLTSSFQGMAQTLASSRDAHAASLAELNEERSVLDALLTTMPVGVVFADRSHIRYCNAAFGRILRLAPDEQLIGLKNDELLLRIAQLAAEADFFLKTIAEILETRAKIEPVFIALRDGRILRMVSNTVVSTESRRFLGRFWLVEDATEEKKMLQMAEMHAEQDPLTLLHNRHRFDQDLQRIIAQAERDGSRVALLIFDLDDFKSVNGLHGHSAGDIVLKQVALTLSTQLRRNEVLYRIGGDEFALLLVNASDDEVSMLAGRIVKSVHTLIFNFNGTPAKVGCSLGIARYPRDAKTLQSLMQLADRAMHEAKDNGKDRFGFVGNGAAPASAMPKQAAKISAFDELSLGIPILDAQHMAMANFIQGILDSLESGDKSTRLQSRVELLSELCQIHFQTEEELMKSLNVSGFNEHHGEHQRQLKNLRSLFGNLSINKQELPTLAREVNEWLLEHIGGHDTQLAVQLKSKGVA